MPNQIDVYQHVTDKIVAALENADHGAWRMPWHNARSDSGVGAFGVPCNVSGIPYRGINVWLLLAEKLDKQYASDTWGTYKAWKAAGAQVRKGEKSTIIVFWKPLIIKERDEVTGETKDKKILMAKYYPGFNADQVDGWQPKAKPELPAAQRIADADAFFNNLPADVRHGGNRAYYAPALDIIQLPEFAQFKAPQAYYATRGHETVHWTGHASRCAREFGTRFGSDAYAFEELVAELGAAYLNNYLGIDNEPRADHAAYLATWIKRMREDKKAIFTAASKAQAAVDFIINAAGAEQAPEENGDGEVIALAA